MTAGLVGEQREAHGDRRVLALAVGVVEPRLEVRDRRLRRPGVRHDAVALVEQPLAPQLVERPHDALHEGEIHRLVVVLHVHPAGLALDVALPLRRVLHHRAAAVGVEARDAVLEDAVAAGQAEVLLGAHLGREAVAVPAEAALDAAAAHRAVARHDVLDVAGQEVPVVRQPVGEGRAVVEDELVLAPRAGRTLRDAGAEDPLALPEGEDGLHDGREARLGGHLGVGARAVRRSGGSFGVLHEAWRAQSLGRAARALHSARGPAGQSSARLAPPS